MSDEFSRTRLLLGADAMDVLASSRVAIFGVGGVGGYVAEALARSGIASFDLIDNDTVSLTNINRQIIAVHSTIGRYKVDVMKERILDINPKAQVNVFKLFYLPETKDQFDFSSYSYVIDAVDTVAAKVLIIEEAKKANVPVISSMGAGNKLDATKFQIADISRTSVCPLARVMRQTLHKKGIKDVKVVFSTEQPIAPKIDTSSEVELKGTAQRVAPGSVSFVPSVAGLLIAGEVIKDLSL